MKRKLTSKAESINNQFDNLERKEKTVAASILLNLGAILGIVSGFRLAGVLLDRRWEKLIWTLVWVELASCIVALGISLVTQAPGAIFMGSTVLVGVTICIGTIVRCAIYVLHG